MAPPPPAALLLLLAGACSTEQAPEDPAPADPADPAPLPPRPAAPSAPLPAPGGGADLLEEAPQDAESPSDEDPVLSSGGGSAAVVAAAAAAGGVACCGGLAAVAWLAVRARRRRRRRRASRSPSGGGDSDSDAFGASAPGASGSKRKWKRGRHDPDGAPDGGDVLPPPQSAEPIAPGTPPADGSEGELSVHDDPLVHCESAQLVKGPPGSTQPRPAQAAAGEEGMETPNGSPAEAQLQVLCCAGDGSLRRAVLLSGEGAGPLAPAVVLRADPSGEEETVRADHAVPLVGARVRVTGFATFPALNGEEGTAVGADSTGEAEAVMVEFSPEAGAVRVPLAYLRLAPPAPPQPLSCRESLDALGGMDSSTFVVSPGGAQWSDADAEEDEGPERTALSELAEDEEDARYALVRQEERTAAELSRREQRQRLGAAAAAALRAAAAAAAAAEGAAREAVAAEQSLSRDRLRVGEREERGRRRAEQREREAARELQSAAAALAAPAPLRLQTAVDLSDATGVAGARLERRDGGLVLVDPRTPAGAAGLQCGELRFDAEHRALSGGSWRVRFSSGARGLEAMLRVAALASQTGVGVAHEQELSPTGEEASPRSPCSPCSPHSPRSPRSPSRAPSPSVPQRPREQLPAQDQVERQAELWSDFTGRLAAEGVAVQEIARTSGPALVDLLHRQLHYPYLEALRMQTLWVEWQRSGVAPTHDEEQGGSSGSASASEGGCEPTTPPGSPSGVWTPPPAPGSPLQGRGRAAERAAQPDAAPAHRRSHTAAAGHPPAAPLNSLLLRGPAQGAADDSLGSRRAAGERARSAHARALIRGLRSDAGPRQRHP